MDGEVRTVAQRIRQTVRDLFGSRLVEHLEEEKFRQQSVYEARLAERDAEIVRLRSEALRLQAKFDEFELDPSYFWWLANRTRKPNDTHSIPDTSAPPTTWDQIQAEHYRRQAEEENINGVSIGEQSGQEVRKQVSAVSV